MTAHLDEKAVFNIARRIDSPEARQDYLRQACGADEDALQRIFDLLRVHEQEQSFLEVPAVASSPTIDQTLTDRVGTQIGPYKLLEQIGEGGFGVVYMAEQTEPVRRKIALKVLKPGMDSRQIVARFEAEKQALAMMDHVNIARVLDAGTTGGEPSGVSPGRPYFVMELVHGVPITKYCDDNRLTPRQRLELFVPVCQAIQHAHQKGIIHRDIKPSNVMVTLYDGKPVPKVIDFGVAKATEQKLTERTLFTQYGTMVGTLEYMSPEQAEMSALGVDTRSDIYSLGVLLYELLTGSTPLSSKRMKEAAFAEILRLIKDEEPPKPSTRLSDSGEALASISAQRHMEPAKLMKLVRGELDWIIMKTLEKDRNRRYETANGFAQDLQRYLNDEPVQACPPSVAYRLRKFARRNKGPVFAASAIVATLLLLVVGLAVSNCLIAEERNQKTKALAEKEQALVQKNLALDHAEAERQRAERNFLKARIALKGILTEAAMGLGEWNTMAPSLRRRFSQGTINFYQGVLEQEGADPSLQHEKAVAYRDISRVHRSWKEYQEAEKFIRQSIAILDRLDKEHPKRHEYRHQLAYSHNILGTVLHAAKRPAEAEAAFQQAVDLYEKMILSEGPLSHLCSELVTSYTPLIRLQKNRGALEDAERTASRIGLLPIDVSHRSAFASMLYTQGLIEQATKQYEEAVRQYEKATRLKADDPKALNNFSWLLATCPVTQVRDVERAVELAEKSVTLVPTERSYWNTLGAARYRTGDWKAAIDALDKSMELGKGGDSNEWFFLAMAHWQLGEKGKAHEYFDQAVQWMDTNIARGHDQPRGRELLRFRAEAAELLGVKDN